MNVEHQNYKGDNQYGKHANKPGEIPKKGWKRIGKRVIKQISADHIPIVSAGVAFYIFLALFPALAAIISIYGLVTDPQQVQQQMTQLASVLPDQAQQFLSGILEKIAGKSGKALGWGVALSILLSLWSANKGTKALFKGVNIAYNEDNTRNFFKENGISLLFTLAGIIIGIICMSLIIGFPAIIGNFGIPDILKTIITWGRWILLAFIIIFSIAAVYKFAPVRKKPKFRWVSWGAILATAFWLIGSWAFSFYVSNFGSFDETYGSIAAVVILMLWFFLTSFLILLGAEINAETEHQTSRDTTVGRDKPMGERGAYYADHVAEEERNKK